MTILKIVVNNMVVILFLICGGSQGLWAQGSHKVHSHNDYQQEFPFWNAYINGAASIEVDIFLRNNTLYVAHEEQEIVEANTLEILYLNKVNELAQSNHLKELQLLVDIKSEAYATLDKLVEVVKNSTSLYTDRKIRFVISGNRPIPEDYVNYPDFITFDHQSLEDLDRVPLEKVALISLNFKKYSVWNGYGRMIEPEFDVVKKTIEKAHSFKKPFRFWATPDTKTAWGRLANIGVDYINTDKPEQVKPFLDKLPENTFESKTPIEVYVPQNGHNINDRPENVILMIGDGNGLAQIMAAMIANHGELTVTGIKDIGLVKTAAHDDLVTDSAAGATAMATGFKANNRAIGVGPDGERLKNLVELTGENGFNTGIITTDAIYGATPSSFYAHRIERDNTQGILEDLKNSTLDFFIAGGQTEEVQIQENFQTRRLDSFNNLERPTAIYGGENKVSSIKDGRKDFLPKSVKKALEVLEADNKPFFLVVEGAQIDNGGHENDLTKIIEEMFDFDKAVSEALQFADTNRNTLVIVTADHETSGLGVVGGNEKNGTVQSDFLTIDHTGIMVPLFAYGPQSYNFTGIYENTRVYWKVLNAMGLDAK